MPSHPEKVEAGGALLLLLCLLSASIVEAGLVYHPKWYGLLLITVPLMAIASFNRRRSS